jgi:hypothetical protein
MTKICGLVSEDPDLGVAEVLDRMYDASWHAGYVRREVWSDERVGLGHFSLGAVNPEPQPLFTEDRRQAIVYCGKIFDYAHLKRQLEQAGVRFRYGDNDAEFLLHLLLKTGTEHLPELNGVFSLALWNADDGSLTLAGDRYGFRPLYYDHDAARGVLAFASDLRAIPATGLPTLRVNWPAVNTFLHFGHLLGTQTLFEGAFRLPPAGVLTFTANDVHLEQYWRLRDLPVRDTMSAEEGVEGCVELFRQAIGRRLGASPARHIVTLSGGQDSRHIAAELHRQGVGFTSYTVSESVLANETLASRVARTLGFPHEVVRVPTEGFLTHYWPRAHALVDYETDLHQWILPLVDHLPDEPHINFDGIVGDVCLSDLFLNTDVYRLGREGRFDQLAHGVLGRAHWLPIYHPSIARHLDRGRLYETVRAEFEAFAGHPNIISFTVMTGRTTRAIPLFAFKLLSEKAESFYPFADNDYFDFAMSIPPEHKLDARMHRRVLDRAYPELRDIPTTKEVDAGEYAGDRSAYERQKRRYLWKGLRDMLRGRPWMYDRRAALPRLLCDLALASLRRPRRAFLTNPLNAVLGQWFERYFPDGVD